MNNKVKNKGRNNAMCANDNMYKTNSRRKPRNILFIEYFVSLKRARKICMLILIFWKKVKKIQILF